MPLSELMKNPSNVNKLFTQSTYPFLVSSATISETNCWKEYTYLKPVSAKLDCSGTVTFVLPPKLGCLDQLIFRPSHSLLPNKKVSVKVIVKIRLVRYYLLHGYRTLQGIIISFLNDKFWFSIGLMGQY